MADNTLYRDEDAQQNYVECWYCQKPLYAANQYKHGDEAYHIDDAWICEDCLKEYMDDNYKEEVGA